LYEQPQALSVLDAELNGLFSVWLMAVEHALVVVPIAEQATHFWKLAIEEVQVVEGLQFPDPIEPIQDSHAPLSFARLEEAVEVTWLRHVYGVPMHEPLPSQCVLYLH
jgi:hypothetical protein